MIMRINDKTTFKSGGFYNLTNQVQENTLLNRGLIDIGGMLVPQMIMSNNKDEALERGVMESIYFASSFLAPFVMLPFFNKTFLRSSGIIKNFTNNERKIIEVSKKYLTKDADLVDGIRKTAEKLEQKAIKKGKKLSVKQDFESIIKRFEGDAEGLKDRLLKTHEKVLFSDFLATSLMWCATPWVAMEFTKQRTKRSGFSATYGMVDENQSKLNAQKHEKEKKKKLLISALLGVVPAIIFPKLVTKGFKDKSGFLSSVVKKIPQSFNYTRGIFPSQLTFAAIWVLCDYPSQIISSRDKYERRDRAIRCGANIAVFFGGDFILNNIFGRLADRALDTKIMDRSKINKNAGFFKKLGMMPKNFSDIEDLKDLSPKILKRTKSVGAALYWVTLVANMGLLGFATPVFLNKMLKKSVKKDSTEKKVK